MSLNDSAQSATVNVSLTCPSKFPLPFVSFSVINPSTLSGAEIKLRILHQLPTEYSRSSMRLIFSGKLVDDASCMLLKGISTPRDVDGTQFKVQCSISGVQMNPEEWKIFSQQSKHILQRLGRDLTFFWPDEKFSASGAVAVSNDHMSASTLAPHTTSYNQTTRGFDKLLESGMSIHEIGDMRRQFWATLAQSSNLANLPPSEVMWESEERWLADGSTGVGAFESPLAINTSDTVTVKLWGAALAQESWYHILGSLIGFLWPFSVILFATDMGEICPTAVETGIYFGAATNVMLGLLSVLAPSI